MKGDSMWTTCMLEHDALDAEVIRLRGMIPGGRPSADWAVGGPIIEADQVFIDPPQEVHVHGGPNAGWHRHNFWSATVSARTRKYKNPVDPAYPSCVGRGIGPTPLIAAMRAVVSSYGPQEP